jgi:hypothetical protein
MRGQQRSVLTTWPAKGLDVDWFVSGGETQKAAVKGNQDRQLSTQTQSFPIINDNVCFHRKPPCGFQDRAPNSLMTAAGWKPEWRLIE